MSILSNNDYFTYYPNLIINEIDHFAFTAEQEGLRAAVENVFHATTQKLQISLHPRKVSGPLLSGLWVLEWVYAFIQSMDL